MSLDVQWEAMRLGRLTAGQLRESYTKILGEETLLRQKNYLIRRIIWRLQAKAEGDLSVRARRRAEQLADDADVRVTAPRNVSLSAPPRAAVALEVPTSHDARLPSPGTSIIRKYKGQKLVVDVVEEGFEFGGERYKSLSDVAKAITGSHCNGFRFFGLGEST